jgi:hypothetical protein
MRALVAGWFSFENSDATAGDLLASDLVRDWLTSAGFSSDIALASPFAGGIALEHANPADYPLVVFVCGPFMRNAWEAEFLAKFAESFIVGVNVSLPVSLADWSPFDELVERDSSRTARADITFGTKQKLVPVVGVCLVEPYDEADVSEANAAIERLLTSREMTLVRIDTRLDVNQTGLRTKAEVESLLARMDAVVTTRLHGMVLSLKNGVPALVIDPEEGGGRIRRQAETVGWPTVFTVDRLELPAIERALDFCLSSEGRNRALECARRAIADVKASRRAFIDAVMRARFRDRST